MVTIVYILAALVLLGLCIFVHELGHLLGGKMVGIKAKTFSLGYGKGFIKKQVGDTTYQITLIPLGGFCSFYGEDPSEERKGEGFEFLSAHPLKRIVTVMMGPVFNLIFGILIFFVMNMVGYTKETNRVIIPDVYKSGSIVSPAYKAGIKDGDTIVAINGKKISDFSGIQTSVFFSEGRELDVKVVRESSDISLKVNPVDLGGGRYGIGVVPYGKRILVAGVIDGAPAALAGVREMDEIVSVNGEKVMSEADFISHVNKNKGKEVSLNLVRKGSELNIKVVPRPSKLLVMDEVDASGKKGVRLTISEMEQAKKLIEKGKLVIDGNAVKSLADLEKMVAGGKAVSVKRDKSELKGILSIEERALIGIFPSIAPEMNVVKHGFADSAVNSIVEPYEFIAMNLKGLGMLIAGKMDVRENLSGPVKIGKIAGDVFYYKGISAFVILMAKISIILMVMNLLPIPAVDGSHILFYTIEAIRGKPLKESVMAKIQTFGIVFLIVLGVFVIINDIISLPAVQKLLN